MIFSKVIKYLTNKDYRFDFKASKGSYKKMSDSEYVKRMFKLRLGSELNLDNPLTFNEKTQWLKIHDRRNVYKIMVDKYDAKKYINSVVGFDCTVPTIGLYKKFKEIDFASLPNSFVIKTTHDSGGFAVVKSKDQMDLKSIKKKINDSLKNNYYYCQREWPYKDLQPRIIIEEYLTVEGQEQCPEFKLFCFDGEVKLFLVCLGSAHGSGRSNDFFDKDFNHLPVDSVFKQYKGSIAKPIYLSKMVEVAKKLSSGLPFLRVDFYCLPDKFYIGELTLYHNAGLCKFDPVKYDLEFGKLINLPKELENTDNNE